MARAAGTRFYVHSTALGCQTNLMDNALFRRLFSSLGFINVFSADDADVLLVNTCGFSADCETRSARIIAGYQTRYPDKEIIVGGCLPGINGQRLSDFFDGFTFGPGEVDRLGAYLTGAQKGELAQELDSPHFMDPEDLSTSRLENRLLLGAAPVYLKLERLLGVRPQPLHNIVRTAAFDHAYFTIPVSSGCLGQCSYCAIKKAKGTLKSVPPERIVRAFRQGLEAGYQDFWLLGDDVGCWGQDIGSDIASLLRRILEVEGDFRLVVNYLEPYYFVQYFERLESLLRDRRVANVNLPMQSGSEKIVRRMGRRYRPDEVVGKLRIVKEHNPELVLKTHLMAGFPGEDEGDFRKTLALVRDFDLIIPFKYTARPGTPAAAYSGTVPEVERRRRLWCLRAKILERYGHVIGRSLVREWLA